ncbi:MAG: ISL3 family transposase [Candidatus Anammoximicrobium sp.]|nr:ISL3 family transposase [Candidatus Anammoximicrobium sp.]
MQLQVILNYVEHYKGFVYNRVRWDKTTSPWTVRVQVVPRANSRAECSGCRKKCAGYDRLPEREFEFVPLWGLTVLLVYAMRRVECPRCGICVEHVPWGDGKCRQTKSYRWFLARWAKRLPWLDVARIFHTSWDTVYRSVRHAVAWGLVHRDVSGVEAIGIDEIQCQRGQRYLTLVYQIDAGCRRLLWIGKGHTEKTLQGFFDLLGDTLRPTLRYVCSDMWSAYLKVVAKRAGYAWHVLDRFHVMANMNKAIDEVRRDEARQLKADGYEQILKHSRWCLLKRRANLTAKQVVKLTELLRYNLKSVRAYLLREDFQRFWTYQSPTWAQKFLRQWCTRAMRSRLEPMKKVALSLRKHESLLMNWFRAKGTISAGVVEGLNNKAKVTMRKSYGFRSEEVLEVVLYHNLGDLPEPKFTHEFC